MGWKASCIILRIDFIGEVGNSLTAPPKGSSCVILVGKNLSRKLWDRMVTFGLRSGASFMLAAAILGRSGRSSCWFLVLGSQFWEFYDGRRRFRPL
jgi:hypothetical protein